MVKAILIVLAAVFYLAAGMAAGYFMSYGLWRDRGYISSVFIKGDVLQVLELGVGILQQYGDKKDGNGNTGVSLENMIIMAGPASSCFNFYIMTSDGRWSFI